MCVVSRGLRGLVRGVVLIERNGLATHCFASLLRAPALTTHPMANDKQQTTNLLVTLQQTVKLS